MLPATGPKGLLPRGRFGSCRALVADVCQFKQLQPIAPCVLSGGQGVGDDHRMEDCGKEAVGVQRDPLLLQVHWQQRPKPVAPCAELGMSRGELSNEGG